MAMLIAAATGNFLTASTWKLSAGQGIIDSEADSIELSNTQLSTNTFVPAAVVIDAVLLKIAEFFHPAGSPAGTVTIELYNDTTSTVARTLTVNATDLPDNGWVCFKFSSTLTPNGTDSYRIRAVRSVAGGGSDRLKFYALTASFSNASRYLRTTTTQAPANQDQLIMVGEITGAGAATSFSLTMDRTTANTDSYGPAASQVNVSLGRYCTLSFGTSASTNYFFKWKGIFRLHHGGTLNIGSSGTRIPSTSTAVLEMGLSASGDSGLTVAHGAILNGYGSVKTVTKTRMTVDKVAGNTVITVSSTSGWTDGDALGFAGTIRGVGNEETKNILTVDSGIQVTLSAGLTSPHSGTSPTQAEVVNLTRNVKIRGLSGSVMGYIHVGDQFVVTPSDGTNGPSGTLDYVELYNLGGSLFSDKEGLTFGYGADDFFVSNCAFHDFGYIYFAIRPIGIIQVTDNSLYNITSIVMGGSGGTVSVTGNWVVKASSSCFGGFIGNDGFVFNNNVGTGASQAGLSLSAGSGHRASSLDGNLFHSNNTEGLKLADGYSFSYGGTFTNTTLWRNNTSGLSLVNAANWTFDTISCFGNADNVYLECVDNIRFLALTSNGDTTYSTAYGVAVGIKSSGGIIPTFVNGTIYIDSSSFSVVSGIKTAHTQNDIISHNCVANIITRNTVAPSISVVEAGPGCIAQQRRGGTAGDHRTDFQVSLGTSTSSTSLDGSVFNTAAPSQKVVASSRRTDTAGCRPGLGMLFNVTSGSTITVGVFVRKAVGYSGAQPRLILKANPAIGVDRDIVLDTMTAGTGAWEQLSGTTPAATDDGVFECVVDCAGGTINVDDWSG